MENYRQCGVKATYSWIEPLRSYILIIFSNLTGNCISVSLLLQIDRDLLQPLSVDPQSNYFE